MNRSLRSRVFAESSSAWGHLKKGKFRYAYHSFEPASRIQRWSPGGCLTLAAAWALIHTTSTASAARGTTPGTVRCLTPSLDNKRAVCVPWSMLGRTQTCVIFNELAENLAPWVCRVLEEDLRNERIQLFGADLPDGCLDGLTADVHDTFKSEVI